jgi:CRP-like cAMP-binding protein
MVSRRKLERVLQGVPLFDDLSRSQLKKLAAASEVVRYHEGATIVREGDPGDSFYVALSGSAKVQVGDRTVNLIDPGDHFGEISLLDGGPRTASVISRTPMILLELDQKHLMKLLRADSALTMALLVSLAKMLRQVDRALDR